MEKIKKETEKLKQINNKIEKNIAKVKKLINTRKNEN